MKPPQRRPFRGKPRPFKKPVESPATPGQEREQRLVADPENDLIYGVHSVAAALRNSKRKHVRLWATENGATRLKEDVGSLPVQPEIVHPRLLDHLLKSQDAVHQGLVLEAKPLHQPRLDQVSRDGVVVVLDQVTDPHNVGAILRSCAAFNVTALITTARHAAETTGVLLKAASGAFEIVPSVTVTNLARALDELKSYGFTCIGLDSEAPQPISDLSVMRPLALVLGAEGKGLRQLTRVTCDQMVRIEMPGKIKSLNVSIAAAISLYALAAK